MWANRVAKCDGNPKQLAQLHIERWQAWNNFIIKFSNDAHVKTTPLQREIDKNEEEFQELLLKSNKGWSKKIVKNVVFDASFGSLNSTSDLDINVISPTTDVLDYWIEYLRDWQETHNGTFTNFYDSNFYFEPSNSSFQPLKLLLIKRDFPWTTDTSYLQEFRDVQEYTEAYRNSTKCQGIFPNPQNMKKEDEITYYIKSKQFGQAFAEAFDTMTNDDIRAAYFNFARCKVEGIISIPALAICGVFGPQVMKQFINKEDIHPRALQIGVYEMLCNLRMHAHKDKGQMRFKSKYAIRLINLLNNNEFICKEDKVAPIEKTNEASMMEIQPAMIFLLDYLDGSQCNLEEYKNIQFDIDKVIETMEKRILGQEVHLSSDVSASLIQLRF